MNVEDELAEIDQEEGLSMAMRGVHPNSELEGHLGIGEFAKAMGFSRATLYNRMREAGFPKPVTTEGHPRWTVAQVEGYKASPSRLSVEVNAGSVAMKRSWIARKAAGLANAFLHEVALVAKWDREKESIKAALVGAGFKEQPENEYDGEGFCFSGTFRGGTAILWTIHNWAEERRGECKSRPLYAEALEAAGFTVERDEYDEYVVLVTGYPEAELNAVADEGGEALGAEPAEAEQSGAESQPA